VNNLWKLNLYVKKNVLESKEAQMTVKYKKNEKRQGCNIAPGNHALDKMNDRILEKTPEKGKHNKRG
jgi:hypothetical protein